MTVWIDYYSTKMVPPPGGCSPKFSRAAHIQNRITDTAHEASLLFYTVSPCCQWTSELLSKSSAMVVWEVVLIISWGTVFPLRKLMGGGLCALPPFLCKRRLWEGEKGGIHWLNYIEKGNGKKLPNNRGSRNFQGQTGSYNQIILLCIAHKLSLLT